MTDNNNSDWAPVGELQNRVELHTTRRKALFLLIVSAVLATASIYGIINDDGSLVRIQRLVTVKEIYIAWMGAILFSIGTLVGLFMLFKPNKLTLTRDGFDENVLRRTHTESWTDVANFELVKVKQGWQTVAKHIAYSKIDEEGNITGKGAISDTYGMKPHELIELLNNFRTRAIAESDNPELLVATLEKSDTWNPGVIDDGSDYTIEQERAPWLRWGLSGILVTMVAAGAIWLGSVLLEYIQAPETKIEFPTAENSQTEPGKEAPPPKSADDQAWIDAYEENTLAAYRGYLEAFPNGRHKEKAQAEIDKYDDKAWASAEERNTIAGYEDYLTDWPEGQYAGRAKERIEEMKKAIEAQKKDAAEKAERARQEAAARAARDRQAWQTAETANTVDSYKAYLSEFPSGQKAAEAQSRIAAFLADAASAQANAIEQAAWESAKANNSAESYQTYLSSYPNGVYAPLAKAALEELRPSPGKTYRDCNVCPLMLTLPSGDAQLGAKSSEPGVKPNEQPQRPVIISNAFSISVTEVTFDQWDACVADGGCTNRAKDNGWGRGKRPVINISWDDAQGYAKWVSNKTGKSYSLPSESQWEYAARGGETGHYMGGSAKALCAFANGAGTESGLTWANKECSDLSSDRTQPAGSLSGNKFGLKDMLGNVQEWTLDCNTLNLKDAPTNGDPDLRGSCNQRVVRGGSWFSPPTGLRFTARENQRRGDSNDFTGFRVVRK